MTVMQRAKGRREP
jgi:transposase InsO family protein